MFMRWSAAFFCFLFFSFPFFLWCFGSHAAFSDLAFLSLSFFFCTSLELEGMKCSSCVCIL